MDHIIETELNSEFLSEARARGYKTYVDHFKASQDYYLGSVQLRVRDDQGTRYFVNIDMFDLGAITRRESEFSGRVHVQFHVIDDREKVADVGFSFADFGGFEEAETFLDDMWRKMKFGYYERGE